MEEKYTNISDNLDNSSVILDIIREYTLFFNSENDCFGKTLFDGIDLLQLSSTNIQLETFYEHMNFYKSNENTNLYKLNEINFDLNHSIYGIFNGYTTECICTSYSLFAVLIEILNLKNINKHKKYFIKQIKS